LKGSGWYVTDYGGKKPSFGESKEEKTSLEAEAASAGESTASTDNKKSDD